VDRDLDNRGPSEADSCIVYENRDRPEGLANLVDCGGDLGFIGHVHGKHEHGVAVSHESGCLVGESHGIEIEES
jgi:hypothetical protein